MRKVVAGLFYSLDGAVESPDRWEFDFDQEMGAVLGTTLESADAILLGRQTYTEWAQYWPNYAGGEDQAFADWINNTPKYVASTTLTNVDEWQNSTLLKGDLADAIRTLKESEGKNINVAGSPGLVVSLMEEGVLDELQLMIVPVAAGQGLKRLFPVNGPRTKLDLVGSQATSSGTIIATYRPAEA